MVVAELDLQQRVPNDVVRFLADALDQPGFGGHLIQAPPFGAIARVHHVQTEANALRPRHRSEPKQVQGSSEWAKLPVVVERGAALMPFELGTEPELVD